MLYLVEYLRQNPEYDSLIVTEKEITFSGTTINLENFDIEKFLSESSNLINNIATLPMKDVFNIIKIHVDYQNMMKRYEEEKAKQMVDEVITNSPSLKNFHLFKNQDNFGYKKSFLQYTDDKGMNYILQDVSEKEFLKAYLDIRNSGLEVNENNLFMSLASKYKQVKMESLFEAEKRRGVTEAHLNNYKNIIDKNKEHMDNHLEVLGNEEYGIYLNGNDVITVHFNKQGKRIVEKHGQSTGNEDELSDDLIASYDAEQLISFEEYGSIICNRESLSEEEKKNVRNMESFIFDVITYKNYLTPELNAFCENYYKLWEYISTIKETTEVMASAINRYNDMQIRSEQREVKNTRNQVTVLQRKLDNSKAGYVNAMLYVGIVVFIGVVIGLITFLAR